MFCGAANGQAKTREPQAEYRRELVAMRPTWATMLKELLMPSSAKRAMPAGKRKAAAKKTAKKKATAPKRRRSGLTSIGKGKMV